MDYNIEKQAKSEYKQVFKYIEFLLTKTKKITL